MRRLRVYENIYVFQRHRICTAATIGRFLNDLELNKEPKEKVLKYFAVLTDLDPVEVDPENEEIIKKMVIDSIQF